MNDGSDRAPYLRLDISWGNVKDLPSFSSGPALANENQKLLAIKQAGFSAVQGLPAAVCNAAGLASTAVGRANTVDEIKTIASSSKAEGNECLTLHVGWGMESDVEICVLAEAIVETSLILDFPVYLETHRATITQDMYRTVELVKKVPGIRFNGDFSHYYTGQEMVYGGFENKLHFLQPVIDRVRFIHGRIGNPGNIQVGVPTLKDELPSVKHFETIWTSCFAAFLRTAMPGDFLPFTTELLGPSIYYAQTFKDVIGMEREETDRWEQALYLCRIAQDCFEEARRMHLSIGIDQITSIEER